jgi:methionyl-tRNA formyltransferase
MKNNVKKFKTIYFGSGRFAVPILEKLTQLIYIDLVAVVTQPDKPVGRNQKLEPTAIGKFCNDYLSSTIVYKPERLKQYAEHILESCSPDLIVVADYGQILPKIIIDYPKYKCLNVHGSILPDLRGAAPIQMSILNGYKCTGVSIPVMTPGLDDGPVIISQKISIEKYDNSETLLDKLAYLGANLLSDILPKWLNNEVVAHEQDHTKATFVDKNDLSKENAQIKIEYDIDQIDRMVRAFYPWPIAWCKIKHNNQVKRLKIFKISELSILNTDIENGVIYKHNKMLFVNFSLGTVCLEDIQLEGKQRLNSNQYLFLSGSQIID